MKRRRKQLGANNLSIEVIARDARREAEAFEGEGLELGIVELQREQAHAEDAHALQACDEETRRRRVCELRNRAGVQEKDPGPLAVSLLL